MKTVVLDSVVLVEGLEKQADVVCELLDFDSVSSSDFLGRFKARPVVRTKV